jgi:hypothetical protein
MTAVDSAEHLADVHVSDDGPQPNYRVGHEVAVFLKGFDQRCAS